MVPKILFYLLVALPGLGLLAQSTYRPGYLITTGGERQEVEIYNYDWADNPTKFRYRNAGGSIQTGDVSNITEFGLADGSLRYLNQTVRIDSSGDHTSNLSRQREPGWLFQRVFLEFLVDGEADLFYWEAGERKRYFYRLGDDVPTQLVNRRYVKDRKIYEQHRYLSQLKEALTCPTARDGLYDLEYEREDLVDYFQTYNACRGSSFSSHLRSAPTRHLRLYATVGGMKYFGPIRYEVSLNALREQPLVPTYGQSIGIELEQTLPLANRRWAVLVGAYYQRVKSSTTTPTSGNSALEMQLINLPVSVKRQFFVSATTSVYLRALAICQITYQSMAYTTPAGRSPLALQTYWNYQLGGAGGFQSGRWWAELRFGQQLDILRLNDYFSSRFKELALVVGYRVW